MKETLFSEHHIRTASGLYLNILNPKPEQISLTDIAHALSNLCRFAGHTPTFYSVAQHSYLAASLVAHEHKLATLFHDATEAYLVDIPRPLKKHLPEYKPIEENLMKVIASKFGFQFPFHPEVKKADETMLKLEWDNLMVCRTHHTHTFLPKFIACEAPKRAMLSFLETHIAIKANNPIRAFTANNL